MEELLYESKGGTPTRRVMLIIATVILVAVGIYFIYLSGAEYEGVTVTIGNTTGRLGGGPMFTEEGQNRLRLLGVISLLLVAFVVNLWVGENGCWIKIYRGYVEGQPLRLGIRKETFSLPFEQITSVSMKPSIGYVVIISGGKSFTIACKEPKKVFQLLDERRREQFMVQK